MRNLFVLFKRFKKLIRLSLKIKIMLLEAFFITGIIRFAILFIPFKRLARIFGKYQEDSSEVLTDSEIITIDEIRTVVLLISRYTPWESKCLVKALTAQIMLSKHKISSTLYLGVAKNQQRKIVAHAWLRSGRYIVTGGYESRLYTEVARFANHVRGKSNECNMRNS